MMKKRYFLAAILAASSFALVGCGEGPSSSQVNEEVKKIAENDVPFGKLMEVTDLTRQNGWKDGDDYKIKFTYNIHAKGDYEAVSAEFFTDSAPEYAAMSQQDRSALLMQMGLSSGFLAEISSDVVDAKKAYKELIALPKVRAAIAAQDVYSKDKYADITIAYIFAVQAKNYGYPSDAKSGHKISRQVTLSYRKTEKGWQRFE